MDPMVQRRHHVKARQETNPGANLQQPPSTRTSAAEVTQVNTVPGAAATGNLGEPSESRNPSFIPLGASPSNAAGAAQPSVNPQNSENPDQAVAPGASNPSTSGTGAVAGQPSPSTSVSSPTTIAVQPGVTPTTDPTNGVATGTYTPTTSVKSSGAGLLAPNVTEASASSGGSSSGISGGAIAGIVVGVIVVLAAVLIGAFLYLRRRKSRGQYKPAAAGAAYSEKSTDNFDTIPVAGANKAFSDTLPLTAEDSTLRRTLGTLFDQLEMHVENFFAPLDQFSAGQAEAWREGIAAAHFQNLSNLKPDLIFKTDAQLAVIKCHLATIIVATLGYSADPMYAIVPPEFAAFPDSLAAANGEMRSGRASDEARAQWRLLEPYTTNASSHPAYIASRDAKISAIVQDFNNAYAPWISDRYSSEEQIQNLSGILVKGAGVGMLLFSQGSRFAFDWAVKGGNARGKRMVVTPGVAKTHDERGRVLDEQRVLVEARTVEL